MKSPSKGISKDKALILTKQGEEILRQVYYYRYMTAQDVTHLIFSPSSLNYVRSLLSRLAGGGDAKTNEYLYRFKLPSLSGGNSKRVYTLGSRGREFLEKELGLPVTWYFRPEKVARLSYGQLMHSLVLTRFLVAAHVWARKDKSLKVAQMRTCYELDLGKSKVVPDAWILFERIGGGGTRKSGKGEGTKFPVLVEIDRGTEYMRRFKEHVAGRIEFVRSGEYRAVFGTEAVAIAYVTAGEDAQSGEVRRRSMCAWTMEVLKEQKRESWAGVFRFLSCGFDEIYMRDKLEGKSWYRPDQEAPVTLFTI